MRRQETETPYCRQVRSRWALGVRAEGHIPGDAEISLHLKAGDDGIKPFISALAVVAKLLQPLG